MRLKRLQRIFTIVAIYFLVFASMGSAIADFTGNGTSAEAARGKKNPTHTIPKAPVSAPEVASLPQVPVAIPAREKSTTRGTAGFQADALTSGTTQLAAVTTAVTPVTNPIIDTKILVISADGTEVDLPAITQVLDSLGTPYTVFKGSSPAPNIAVNRLTSLLSNSNHGFFQGVILTTGSLAYTTDGGSTWNTALTSDEWNTLWNYEASFGIRQITWYTFPTADYGFQSNVSGVSTDGAALPGTLTATGKTVFSSVNSANTVKISKAWTYTALPAASDATGTVTALLTDASGNALINLKNYADGRANLAMTFDGNQYLTHTLQLSYDLINWVTNGLFLGDRHVYVSPQVDDIFIPDDIWTPTTPCGTSVEQTGASYRMTGTDVKADITWQKSKQATPISAALRLNMVFNGSGIAGQPDSPDLTTDTRSLSSVAIANQGQFYWINHTYSHANLDAITYADASSEFSQNIALGDLNFGKFNQLNLVQPDVSGLGNPNAMQAAYDNGIRYVVSDTSKLNSSNITKAQYVKTNTAGQQILAMPRYPNNLFYNVSKPDEWAAEYNCLYSSYWGRNLTATEIINIESDTLVRYMLNGDLNPWMFHQANLRAYSGTHTLLGDLIDATLTKYSSISTLPIVSPAMNTLGTKFADRLKYSQAGVTATIQNGTVAGTKTITLTAKTNTKVQVTGLKIAGAETYGGRSIATVTLKANTPVTYTIA